jgi:hypothetical protein
MVIAIANPKKASSFTAFLFADKKDFENLENSLLNRF